MAVKCVLKKNLSKTNILLKKEIDILSVSRTVYEVLIFDNTKMFLNFYIFISATFNA